MRDRPTPIYGGSPWTRQAIARLTDDELEQIDEAIPDDMFVSLGAARRPGIWTVFLMRDNGTPYPERVMRVEGVHNLVNGVRTAVRRWEAAA